MPFVVILTLFVPLPKTVDPVPDGLISILLLAPDLISIFGELTLSLVVRIKFDVPLDENLVLCANALPIVKSWNKLKFCADKSVKAPLPETS